MSDEPFDEPLPAEAEIRKLAVKGAEFKAGFAAQHLPRFAAATENATAKVNAAFTVGLDDQRRYAINGTVSCETQVVCQRCMGLMPLSVHCELDMIVVYDDVQAKQLPRSIEPLVVADGELVNLNELVEDELLLNMPFTSFHNDENCHAQRHEFLDPNAPAVEQTSQNLAEDDQVGKTDNPFSVLSQLKGDKH